MRGLGGRVVEGAGRALGLAAAPYPRPGDIGWSPLSAFIPSHDGKQRSMRCVSVAGLPALLGRYDLLQRRHSVLRNYPIVGHFRYALEDIRPEMQ